MLSDATCAFAGLPFNVTELHSQHEDRGQPKYVLDSSSVLSIVLLHPQTDGHVNVEATNNLTLVCVAARSYMLPRTPSYGMQHFHPQIKKQRYPYNPTECLRPHEGTQNMNLWKSGRSPSMGVV